MSVEEAARRLGGVSKWTIYAWLSQGRLQRTKVGGRTMIRESELEKVIQDGGKSPAPRGKLSATGRPMLQEPLAEHDKRLARLEPKMKGNVLRATSGVQRPKKEES
jgi:excisionase family DNA binding protein